MPIATAPFDEPPISSALDIFPSELFSGKRYVNTSTTSYNQSVFTFASSNSYQLDLNVFSVPT